MPRPPSVPREDRFATLVALRHVVEDGHGHAREQERRHFSGHQRNRQALKIGSKGMTPAPTIIAAAVRAMGRNRTAPASTTAARGEGLHATAAR